MLGIIGKLRKQLRIRINPYEYAMVYGSHHAIKDANNPRQMHFYDYDIWSNEGHKLDGLIPENYVVYGELIGWVPSRGTAHGATASGDRADVAEGHSFAPIQKNYTYDLEPGTCKLYIYRVATVNGQGTVSDLSWGAVRAFCDAIGVAHVPELWRGRLWELQGNFPSDTALSYLEYEFLDTRYKERGYKTAVHLAPESPCDEGICIRIDDHMVPTIVKAKSPLFLQHETAMNDKGVMDIETTGDTEAVADDTNPES